LIKKGNGEFFYRFFNSKAYIKGINHFENVNYYNDIKNLRDKLIGITNNLEND
jgi:hypothetical protein